MNKTIEEINAELTCNVCDKKGVAGVAAIPFIPMSVAYCRECLNANAHPWWALVGNQSIIGDPLETTHPEWQRMVHDTCAHLGKTVEDFNRDVLEAMNEDYQ